MILNGQVGPVTATASLGVNSTPALRMDNMGGAVVTQLAPRYYEETYRRSMFTIANQTGVTSSAALSTTYVGLCLDNPTISTVNLVLTKVGYAFSVAPAASVVVGLMTGTGASITAAVTPRNRYVGGASAQALASTSLTLPGTPVLETILGVVQTGALTTSTQLSPSVVDLEGSLILPPGAFVCFYTSTASGASGFFGSFQWVEVPI